MNLPTSSLPRLTATLAVAVAATATLAAAAVTTARADEAPSPAMLTMAQAVTIAEATQNGIAYDMKRATAGTDVIYRVKVSTPDRGIVDVQVAAYGGRVEARRHEHRRTPA